MAARLAGMQLSVYNCRMHPRIYFRYILLLAWLAVWLNPATLRPAGAALARPAQSSGATAYDLIIAMNSLRASYGLPQLKEDAIINAVAQSTAEIMAANQMSSHIGDVRGRLAAAGYGGGATVWATENFAVGSNGLSIDEIMQMWSDSAHMIPAVNPAYCSVGAGKAESANGRTYYILQAAYTSSKSCGEYKSVGGTSGGGTPQNRDSTISQIIVPVKIATPDADGKLYHEVRAGQSFWAIAVAYKITIKDIEIWNNISRNTPLKVGLKLFIPTSNTAGYSTPTPVGMVRVATPDADGKVVHVVEAYHTLSTIAKAYGITVEQILQMNGLQLDWPLQIGQKILIDPGNVTPSPTPRPLTPLEKLTPESDGKLYHTVQSGETLYWIANLYGVGLNELMAWNGLSNDSVIKPDQKLVLQVTMPATATNTPGPPTLTPVPTKAAATATPSPTTTRPMETATLPATPTTTDRSRQIVPLAIGVVGLLSGGLFLFGILTRRRS